MKMFGLGRGKKWESTPITGADAAAADLDIPGEFCTLSLDPYPERNLQDIKFAETQVSFDPDPYSLNLSSSESFHERKPPEKKYFRKHGWRIGLAVSFVIGVIILVVITLGVSITGGVEEARHNNGDDGTGNGNGNSGGLNKKKKKPKRSEPSAPFAKADSIEIILEYAVNDEAMVQAMREEGTPQNTAFKWLRSNTLVSHSLERMTQRYALACLYFATTMDEGIPGAGKWNVSTNWLNEHPNVDGNSTGEGVGVTAVSAEEEECSWFGIQCDKELHVTEIKLKINNLNGTLPNELSLLSKSLTSLDVSSNNLFNTDHEGLRFFGSLTGLRALEISDNFFTLDEVGFPDEWKMLTALESLKAAYNVFVGGFGEAFASLTSLTTLDLEYNSMSDTIPEHLGDLSSLKKLFLRGNEFDTDLSFMKSGKLTSLEYAWVDQTPNITGTLFSEMSLMTSLKSWSLADCALTGTLPTELGLMTNLENFWINGNKLTGDIPTEFGRLSNLNILTFDNNTLQGSMPMEICTMLSKTPVHVLQADCLGNPPDVKCDCCTSCFDKTNPNATKQTIEPGTFTPLYIRSVVAGALQSSVAEEMDKMGTPQNEALKWLQGNTTPKHSAARMRQRFALAALYFATQQKGWAVSTSWLAAPSGKGNDFEECAWFGVTCDKLMQVTGIELPNNGLKGILPAEMTLLAATLGSLDVHGNELANKDDELDFLGYLTELTYLDIGDNYFDMLDFPQAWSKLTKLETFDAQYNLFGGIFGNVVSFWKNLNYIDVEYNSMTGSIPMYIGDLSNLEFLYLSGNFFKTGFGFLSGGRMAQLQHLWMDENEITGTLVADFGVMTSLESISLSETGVHGKIPPELGLLTKLDVLTLAGNSLTGTISPELGLLHALEELKLQNNDLQGDVPNEVCGLVNAKTLTILYADCAGQSPAVRCSCCTKCFTGGQS